MNKILNKILRNAIINNGYMIGSREVLKNIDNAKLVICSNTIDNEIKNKIKTICKEKNIPIYDLNNTSKELGRLCNKPFRVSILSLSVVENSDLEELLKESDLSIQKD